MRASTAYFAGAGTVIAAIVGGLGGGLLIADMISPKSPKATETTRLERRMASEPIQTAPAPSEPVPYPAALQSPASGTAVAAAPAQAPAQNQSANSTPAVAPPADAAATPRPATAAPAPPAVAAVQPTAAREQAAAPEDAQARARDSDVKRVVEKRNFERRQRWAERRRQRQELRTVEEKVREETEPRREFAAEPVKIEMPLIKLFGQE